MPQPLRILVAGAGLFGREHLDRLVKRADVQVVGVADPSRDALEAVRTRHVVPELFGDAREMLKRVPADGVIVATPSATHVDLTEHALSRGMAVLLEKPVAPSSDEAERLAAAAKRSGKLVLPGHVLRFSKDHQRVAAIVASGAIGRPLYINSRRYRDDSHAVRYSDVDPILMTMIHDIDLALWFAGEPFRSAQSHRQPAGDFRSMTAATCITQNGIICNLRTAWTFGLGDEPPDRVEVVGDRGSVELEPGRSFVQFAGGSKREVGVVGEDDALTNEQAHFLECLRDPSHKPALTLEDASHGLQLAGALMKSIETGRNVELSQ
jgi:predicted dehydrogenase